jgi:uncharacterized protein
MQLEQKFSPAGGDVTLVDGHVIAGYASVFGQSDHGGDSVAPGAYRVSLASLAAKKISVKMLWQHDPREPIGVWDEVREDERGLFVRGRLLMETRRGQEAAALVGAGAIDGLSIGYRTRKASRTGTGGRVLEEIELWEVSLVTFPMLPEARVGAKGERPSIDQWRDLAAAFRSASRNLADG